MRGKREGEEGDRYLGKHYTTKRSTIRANKTSRERRLKQESGLDESRGNPVRINVGGRTTIFQVSLSFEINGSGNPDGSTTIRNTSRELTDALSLVFSGQPHLVVFTVNLDVLQVPLGKLLDVLVNGLDTTLLPGLLGGVVGVTTGTVPVTLSEGLGVERRSDTPLLTDPQQQEPSHPQVITHGDSQTRSDLELPLSGHDLGVDSGDLDSSVQTSTVVGLDEVTSKDLSGSDTTVVRTLRSGEPTLGPTVRLTIGVEQGVLLLESEPRLVSLGQVHVLLGHVPVVVGSGSSIGEVTSTENEDVIPTPEGITEDRDGPQENIGIVSRSLLGGRTIKVPLLQLGDLGDLLAKSHGLASKSTGSIDPDVFGHDLLTLRQVHVRLPQIDTLGRNETGHLD